MKIKEEKLFIEAIELIRYFVKRVEEGSIRSKTTYVKYKQFLEKVDKYGTNESSQKADI